MLLLEDRVQESAQEDVDLDSHEFPELRHTVVDPSKQDKSPSKVARAVLGHTPSSSVTRIRACAAVLSMSF